MHYTKLISIILFSLSLSICKAQSPDKATLYIVRTSGLGAAINFKYFIDDQFIGKTNYGKYFKVEVEPGEHIIWVKAENRSFVYADLEAGKTYMLDAVPQMGAFKTGVWLKAINEPTTKDLEKINKFLNKKKLISYDEEKRRLEQNDYAGLIKKSLVYYEEKVAESPDLEKLTTPVEL